MSMYRRYLLFCAITFLAWGLAFFVHRSNWEEAPSFVIIKQILPLWLWGVITTVMGLGYAWQFAIAENLTRKTKTMNILAGAAAFVHTVWFIAFVHATFSGVTLSPLLPGFSFYIASVHMIAIQAPMVDPEQELDTLKRAILEQGITVGEPTDNRNKE